MSDFETTTSAAQPEQHEAGLKSSLSSDLVQSDQYLTEASASILQITTIKSDSSVTHANLLTIFADSIAIFFTNSSNIATYLSSNSTDTFSIHSNSSNISAISSAISANLLVFHTASLSSESTNVLDVGLSEITVPDVLVHQVISQESLLSNLSEASTDLFGTLTDLSGITTHQATLHNVSVEENSTIMHASNRVETESLTSSDLREISITQENMLDFEQDNASKAVQEGERGLIMATGVNSSLTESYRLEQNETFPNNMNTLVPIDEISTLLYELSNRPKAANEVNLNVIGVNFITYNELLNSTDYLVSEELLSNHRNSQNLSLSAEEQTESSIIIDVSSIPANVSTIIPYDTIMPNNSEFSSDTFVKYFSATNANIIQRSNDLRTTNNNTQYFISEDFIPPTENTLVVAYETREGGLLSSDDNVSPDVTGHVSDDTATYFGSRNTVVNFKYSFNNARNLSSDQGHLKSTMVDVSNYFNQLIKAGNQTLNYDLMPIRNTILDRAAVFSYSGRQSAVTSSQSENFSQVNFTPVDSHKAAGDEVLAMPIDMQDLFGIAIADLVTYTDPYINSVIPLNVTERPNVEITEADLKMSSANTLSVTDDILPVPVVSTNKNFANDTLSVSIVKARSSIKSLTEADLITVSLLNIISDMPQLADQINMSLTTEKDMGNTYLVYK